MKKMKRHISILLFIIFIFSTYVPVFPAEVNENIESNVEAASDALSTDEQQLLATASVSTTVPVSLSIDAVSEPFNIYNNDSEAVSVATGALTYEKPLLSLPGRNGLDLDISIKYNSEDAVVTENEYDSESSIRNSNYNNFAVGWSFGFPHIIKEKVNYGLYYDAIYLRMPDGSTYKVLNDSDYISEDKELTLQYYKLRDKVLIRDYETKNYILSYSDGVKEYFDGTHGCILKREDRFGNTITFEYTDISYFRGNFIDYIFNPSIYQSTWHLLTKITDSVGRIVDIEYDIPQTSFGKIISAIKIKLNNTYYATVNFDRVNSYNGEVNILESIIDGENYITKFNYEEKMGYIYYPMDSSGNEVFSFNGSVFLLTKVENPTGGITEYKYKKERRSHTYKLSAAKAGWYHVYKVSESKNSLGDIIKYSYEGDRSGYPSSYINSDACNYPDGYIFSHSVKYYTIVEHNNKSTVYTFDYMHNKQSELIFDNQNSAHEYIAKQGEAQFELLIDNKIYRVGIVGTMLYIYQQTNNEEPVFLNPTELKYNYYLQHVGYAGNKIYAFAKQDYSLRCYLIVKIYDIETNSWSDGDSYTPEYGTVDFRNFNVLNMINAGSIFYSIRFNPGYNYIVVYDTNKPSGSRWYTDELYATDLYHILGYQNAVYYKSIRAIYKYNLEDQTYTGMGTDVLHNSDSVSGFHLGDRMFAYVYDNSITTVKIYEFNFETKEIINKYTYSLGTGSEFKFQSMPDGSVYCLKRVEDDNGLYAIYKFNPDSEEIFELITYRIFDHHNFDIMSDDNTLYLSLGLDSGYGTTEYYTNPGGYEIIDLSKTDSKEYIKTSYEYNSSHQITSAVQYALNKGANVIGSENNTYLSGYNVIKTNTDSMNNITSYEYTDSTYHLPTKKTEYTGTDNELITVYELSQDKTKVISSTVQYDDRNIKTEYIYDTVYPGNIVEETISEIKDDVVTVLSNKEYVYDENGLFVVQEKDKNILTNNMQFELQSPFDIIKTYSYDIFGNIISKTDENGRTTTYSYNKNQWLLRTVFPDNTLVEKTYNISANNNLITTSFNNQYYTKDYYDEFGRISVQKEIDDESKEKILKSYTYNKDKLIGITDGNGNYTSITYDVLDRVTSMSTKENINSPPVYTQSVEYDDYNLKKTDFSGTSSKTSYYDKLGRVIKEEQNTDAGLNTVTYEYDYAGRLIKTTDALGNSMENSYNDLGQLISVINALDQTTLYEYNKRGDVSKVTYSGGNIKNYEYDNLGRLIKTIDALSNTEHYAYDNVGNVISYKDRKSQITTNIYDNMNRLTSKQVGNIDFSYTYDSFGNKLTMTDETGTTAYSYTYNNKLSQITMPDNKTVSYSYDNTGNIIRTKDYNDNIFNYTYDCVNRIDTITKDDTVIADYVYNDTGVIQSVTYPEGTTAYTYDNALRLIGQTNTLTNGTVINNYVYTYDITGNQLQKKETVNNIELITDYTYDALNRLSSVTEPDNTVTSYVFDSGNNIVSKTIQHPSTYQFGYSVNNANELITNITQHNISYNYNSLNQLVSQTENVGSADENIQIITAYTYDLNGNTIKNEKTIDTDTEISEYTYNSLNQMIRYKSPENILTDYGYDGTGMRVSKTQGNNTVKYYWDRGYISNEITNNTTNVSNYIGLQGVFARQSGNSTEYMFKNGHGDVVALAQNGSIASSYDYDAFGNQKQASENDNNPFRYSGEYQDLCSGLIYLRNRYYDPSIGRFISEDPIRHGTNWYIYANNNPVNYIDPLGLDAVLITADHAAAGAGHTSIITQDTRDGKWYYFYWGDKATYFVEVPWEDGAMSSLDNFNSWLNNQDLPYSTKNYTSATFVEGDFNASVDYFKDLVAGTTIEKGYRMEAGRYDKPTMEYYQINKSYSLLKANCLQMSMKGFYKGTLKNGTSVNSFMNGQLDKTWMADTIPNFAEDVFNQLFFNRRFTRSDAKNDVTWEALYGSPGERYKTKGLFYAKTLGVSK